MEQPNRVKGFKGEKSEEFMGIFGRGHGWLGLPKIANVLIRVLVIWIAFGSLAVYFLKSAAGYNPILALICCGLALLFTALEGAR